MNKLRIVLLLLLPVLSSGCGIHVASVPAADYYYLNPDKDLSSIGRAAIIELDNNSSYPRISVDVTETLFQALQKKQIFSLAIVRQSDPAWRRLQLESQSTYTLEQLLAMRKTLNCDAVLIGTVTEFRPYPHMLIGLRLELMDLTDGQLLWCVEQVWDTADKTTEKRIKGYCQRRVRPDIALSDERLVIMSSLKFIKFVAYEVAETLQPKSY